MEAARLALIEQRDGTEAMLRWAEQTLACYVAEAVRTSQYRDSIRTLTDTLASAGRRVRIVTVEWPVMVTPEPVE